MAIFVLFFWRFSWAKMVELSPIDLKLNDIQNKVEVNISMNVAKI